MVTVIVTLVGSVVGGLIGIALAHVMTEDGALNRLYDKVYTEMHK